MFGLNPRLRNNRGNVTLFSVILLGAILTGAYFATGKIMNERKLTAAMKKNIGANLALRSVTDYIRYGIRKSWCFDENMLPELPENCVGSFKHERSTFRLLMPLSYETNLRILSTNVPSPLPSLPGGDLHLKKIEFTTALENITAQHPLAKILGNFKNSPIKYVKIQLNRIEDQTMPASGDEVFVQVIVQFLDSSSNLLQDGSEFYRESSRFVSVPREVNSFGLIVAGNMYLGTSAAPPSSGGHFYAEAGKNSDNGISFNSPVFVNGNIQINEKVYTPVRFNDNVTLGNGQILNNAGVGFQIGEALGVKKYWTDLKIFGGFSRGFDSDSKRDSGLDNLAGVIPSIQLNNEIIQRCISLIRASSNLDMTSDSILTARRLNTDVGVGTQFTNRYSFSTSANKVQNVFVPQVLTGLSDSASAEGHIWYDKNVLDINSQKLIFWADVIWYNEKIRVPLMENSDGSPIPIQLKFAPYNEKEVNDAEADYKLAQKKFEDLSNELEILIKAEPAKSLVEPPKSGGNAGSGKADSADTSTSTAPSAGLLSWIAWDKLRDDKTVATDASKVKADQLKSDWQKKKDYYEDPATISFVTAKPSLSFSKKQSVFREIFVKISNSNRFVERKENFGDGPYQIISPEYLRFEGMDYSAKNGVSLRLGKPDFNAVYHKFSEEDGKVKVSSVLYKKDLTTEINTPGADEAVDYESLAESCYSGTNLGGGVNLDAFQPAGWATSFTSASQDSWHFASPDPKATYYDQTFSSNSANFDVGAIRKTCTIMATTNFITGFYVCQDFVIAARSTPLEIVGTFIVSRNFSIHPSAVQAGITWSSIHNQKSVEQLKARGILKRSNGSSCNTLPKPHWHPDPGLVVLSDRLRCSPDFLLQGKNPPRWTSVDPDCGRLNATDTTTKCMKRIRNFNIIQLERIYGF